MELTQKVAQYISDSSDEEVDIITVILFNKLIIFILFTGDGNFGIVTLTQLEHRPDVSFACKTMALENHGNNSYSSESSLKAMRTVGNDRHPYIVHFYAARIDLIEGQSIICMEVLDRFYPILHSCFKPTNIVLVYLYED
ncbi:unnamed protein product [Rotaria magnacalcarata]